MRRRKNPDLKNLWVKAVFKDKNENALKKYLKKVKSESDLILFMTEAENYGMTEIAYLASKKLKLLHKRYRAVLIHEEEGSRTLSVLEEEMLERKERTKKTVRRIDL